jgi:SAM-dependent methyltransferase
MMEMILKKISGKIQHGNKSGPFACPVCEKRNIGMDPLPWHYLGDLHRYGFVHNIFLSETLNLLHYSCKNCFATDRERLISLYLKEYLKKQPVSLLDIAPSDPLSNFIKKQTGVSYRSMDLLMRNVDDNMDITNMYNYQDSQFDFFICSHVLEHVADDKKAMAELYRILKPGGKGIVMVPINLGLSATLEDPSCTDIAMRWKLYGQNDHIRMYDKNDFTRRLTLAGFTIDQLGINHFGKDVFEKAAIFPTSVLYVVNK